ncbi:homocysteine S-methyltransferase-like [Teleopsis dalmanni]|uniref:homocysteine S-methyltransferase-like n=1 Tax=Teleopsis dalmanni TaxID=139649 RepID=UPI0018CD0E92|nr:homocysteine S-methyltransferase-like [Teleopsis dalmanni]
MSVNSQLLVKCGGFATQLATYVGHDDGPLWGAQFDATNPEAVLQTHMDALMNGAQIILSNTYQVSIAGLMKYLHYSEVESWQHIKKSVRLAKDAAAKYNQIKKISETQAGGLPMVLASIGPYGACLHDGSEYTGNYANTVTKEYLQEWHKPRIEACLEEGIDGLAVETIPCQIEGEAVAEMLLTEYKHVKFWTSFQCKDGIELANGDNFALTAISIWDLVKKYDAIDRFLGIGVNCVQPEYVTDLIQSVHDVNGDDIPPFVVYSNSGEVFNVELGIWEGGDHIKPLASFVDEWVNLGVKIIGGCCRVYPNSIKQIRERIDNINSSNNSIL